MILPNFKQRTKLSGDFLLIYNRTIQSGLTACNVYKSFLQPAYHSKHYVSVSGFNTQLVVDTTPDQRYRMSPCMTNQEHIDIVIHGDIVYYKYNYYYYLHLGRVTGWSEHTEPEPSDE